jgi:hypothetical protein
MFYYRRGKGVRVPIKGTPGTAEFDANYHAAVESYEFHCIGYKEESAVTAAYKDRILNTLKKRMKNARSRDKKKGRAHTISDEWLAQVLDEQQYLCAVTRLPFVEPTGKVRINPYSPSLDRLDCNKGYEVGNVRIVLFAVNMMMLDWGDEIFSHVALAYVRQSQPKSQTKKAA